MKGLKRVAALYGMVEQVRSAEASVAAAGVAQVVAARKVEENAWRQAVAEGRAALAGGDGVGWASAEWTRGACEGRVARLVEVQLVREGVRDEAMAAHQASRMRTEQVVSVLDRADKRLEVEEGRKMQAAADDRYGSRLAWVKRR